MKEKADVTTSDSLHEKENKSNFLKNCRPILIFFGEQIINLSLPTWGRKEFLRDEKWRQTEVYSEHSWVDFVPLVTCLRSGGGGAIC